MVKPKQLNPGDRIAAITLSWGGPGAIPYRYEIGKKQFQDKFGVTIVETRHACKDPKWIYHNPKARAEDLMAAFSDTSIKGIVSTIGGEDSIRLLPFIDLDIIRNNPKVFIGYSDTTITHFVCFKAGLVSFYGPSIMANLAENMGMFDYLVRSIQKTLFSKETIGTISPNETGWTNEFLDWSEPSNQMRRRKTNASTPWRFLQGRGTHFGHLIGGCLESLEFLKGTDYWPHKTSWAQKLLFLETSENGPPPTYVKRSLRNLGAQGVISKLSGIIFGRPGGTIPVSTFEKYDEAIMHVVSVELGFNELPIITNMDFGHTDPAFIIPYGVKAKIDCNRKTLSILENAVE